MIVDDFNYDIDNVDLEEQMLIQDVEEEIQEEQNIQEEEEAKEEKRIQEEADKTYFQNRRILNAKNLNIDLDIDSEELRPKYTWESNKDGQLYEGCVVHKFDNTSYIFNASIKGENNFKLRKFSLDNIKQIKK